MSFTEIINNEEAKVWIIPALGVITAAIVLLIITRSINKAQKKKTAIINESLSVKENNQTLTNQVRERVISNLQTQARLLMLNPVTPGKTIDNTTLESRNRAKCIQLIIDDLPRDIKSQGIRMAEFIHHLSDNLFQSYGKDAGTTQLNIDTHPIILDAECAAHVGLMMNELISNTFEYAPVPGEKTKITIILKERTEKLFISVADNGIGMKSPYPPKFSFGLQLVSSLVQKYKGEMTISSRPGTRVEISLSEYQKAAREVFVTPTQRIH